MNNPLQNYYKTLQDAGFKLVPLYNHNKFNPDWKKKEVFNLNNKETGMALKTGYHINNLYFSIIDIDIYDEGERDRTHKKILFDLGLNPDTCYYEITTSGGIHIPIFIEDIPNINQSFRFNNIGIELFCHSDAPAVVIAPSRAINKQKEIGQYTANKQDRDLITAIKTNKVKYKLFKIWFDGTYNKNEDLKGTNKNRRAGDNQNTLNKKELEFIKLDEGIKEIQEQEQKEINNIIYGFNEHIKIRYNKEKQKNRDLKIQDIVKKEYEDLFNHLGIKFKHLGYAKSGLKYHISNFIPEVEKGAPKKYYKKWIIEEAIKSFKETTRVEDNKKLIKQFGGGEHNIRVGILYTAIAMGLADGDIHNIFRDADDYKYNLTQAAIRSGRRKTLKPYLEIYLNNNLINYNNKAVVIDANQITLKNPKTLFYLLYKYGYSKFMEYIKLKGLEYSIKDKEGIFNIIDDLFKLDTNKINIDGYIEPKDIKTVLGSSEDKTIGIKAPTGAGKTTAIINYAVEENKKIIFLVPYYSMALQQATQNKLKGFIGLHQEHKETEETIKEATKIIATYDQLYNIIKVKGVEELGDYLLVVDEYHNLITQYDFRYKRINTILNYKEAFNKVIYISGTYEGLNIENNKIYEFKPKHQRKNNYIIKTCKNKEGLGHLINELKGIGASAGKYLVFINNIEVIKQVQEELQGINNNIHILTAGNKNNPIMDNIYNEECLKEDGIYLTTSLICDGINIKDKDIKGVYIYGVSDIYQIGQYIARFRSVEPDIIHIVEPKRIKDVEKYEEYINSNENIIEQIIQPLNRNREELIKQGEDLKEHYNKELKGVYIFEEEKFIKLNQLTNLLDIDRFKLTASYLERLNKRILTNPKAIKEALLKFYPSINITIEKAKQGEEVEKNTRDKKELVDIVLKYDYDIIRGVLQSRDDLEGMDKTGITQEEYYNIKEVGNRHKKALKRIVREEEYNNNYGIGINIKEKDIERIKEKYNIKELPAGKEKELYLITANPKAIKKHNIILDTAKAIILDRQGKIEKDKPIQKEGLAYKHTKIIIDAMVEAYNNNKNMDIPTLLKQLKELPKDKGRSKRDTVIKIIKCYGSITVENETITIKNIEDTILEAYNRDIEEKDYLKILKEHTGEVLHEGDILELLEGKNNLLEKYHKEGYLHNVRFEHYLVEV